LEKQNDLSQSNHDQGTRQYNMNGFEKTLFNFYSTNALKNSITADDNIADDF
jgi:hypothetical protein